MAMEVPGKRRRGRPKRWWLDNIRNDLSERELSEEEVQDRIKLRRLITNINPTCMYFIWQNPFRLQIDVKSIKKKKEKSGKGCGRRRRRSSVDDPLTSPRNKSRMWKTMKRGNLAVKRVRNHWEANMCVSRPWSRKCSYNSGSMSCKKHIFHNYSL